MATTTTRDNVELYYVSRGHGQPILFVHGWLGSHRLWDRQLYLLQDKFHCIAMDLRGMGQSEKTDSRHDFHEFGEDLRHLIKELALKEVTLVGWSMGVSVTLSYLSQFQNEGDVARVVLVNGPIKLIQSEDWKFGLKEKECLGYINGIADDPINGRRDFAAANLLNPTDAEIDFLFHISLQTPLDIALKAVKYQMKLDHRPVLERLRIPCLAIQTDHDFYPIGLGTYIAERAPMGKLVILNNSGHSCQLQDATRFNKSLVDFIEST